MSVHSLMFGWEFPPRHAGGLGVACQGLVRGLLHHSVDVTLVLPSSVGVDAENLHVVSPTTSQMHSIIVPSDLQPYDTLQSYSIRQEKKVHDASLPELYGPNLGDAVHSYTQLAVEMTRDVDTDVIHCHDWMTYDAALHAASYHKVPVVAHVHATEFDRTDAQPNPWIAGIERRALRKMDRVVAVSNYTKRVLQERYDLPGDKISVVHNGHSCNPKRGPSTLHTQFGVHKKRPLVLFLGRLTVQKNPLQFLEIAKRVVAIRPDVQFVMAGDGQMLPFLMQRACEMGVGHNVIFTGKVNSREAEALYREADCFVMPSLSEPFGLVALEAIANDTPVILSKQSGAAEVIDDSFKVDFWDSDLMADCLLTILREEPLSRQLRTQATNVLHRLTWENQADRIKSIYHDLIQC